MKKYLLAIIYTMTYLYSVNLCFGEQSQNNDSLELTYYRAQLVSFRQEYGILNKKIEDLSQLNAKNEILKLDLEKQIAQLKKENSRLSAANKGNKQQDNLTQDGEKEELRKQVLALSQEVDKLKRNSAVLESMIDSQTADLRSSGSQKTSEKNADKVIHTNLGYAYGIKGRYKEAIQEYKKALQYAPNDKDIFFNLGFLLTKQKRYKEAIEVYEKALRLDPRDREIYYNLAVIYANNLNDPINSQECYKKFKALSDSTEFSP